MDSAGLAKKENLVVQNILITLYLLIQNIKLLKDFDERLLQSEIS